MWKSGWGNFKKMEGEGWRRILCGGAEGDWEKGGGTVRKRGGTVRKRGGAVRKRGGAVRNGRGRLRERWRGAAGWWRGNRKKAERVCGGAEDILWRAGEAVRKHGEALRTRRRSKFKGEFGRTFEVLFAAQKPSDFPAN